MRFTQGRRRAAPSVIIVSLIDVLLVVLIFLMVSTTFRQMPSVPIVLPEAKDAQSSGSSQERLVVTVARTEPHLFLNARPITFERLREELLARAAANTNLSLTIATDEGAPFGEFWRVSQAAHEARFRTVDVATRNASEGP
jgi:biopolymer transport protein ExbD